MGKRRAAAGGSGQTRETTDGPGHLEEFVRAARKQLADKQRVVRMFDIGGSGVKTALISAAALQTFLAPVVDVGAPLDIGGEAWDVTEPDWIEPPTSLGSASGEDGFALWLREALPRLAREVENNSVCFGVSIGGDVNHATGEMEDWWPAGGHPRQWGSERPNPKVADIMGLPAGRTFAIHDGEAHLLGCCRSVVPPPNLGCFAIGTGVGFGISDGEGAIVDPSIPLFARSVCLNGVPLSGAAYPGVWRQWLDQPGVKQEDVGEVMEKDFANMARPWRMPWVSLVLGRRGMELAEAAYGAPPPPAGAKASEDGCENTDNAGATAALSEAEEAARQRAVRAFAEQWLHFLHTQFIPQFGSSTRKHTVHRICFAGGLVEMNWHIFQEVMLEPGEKPSRLRGLPEHLSRTTAPQKGRQPARAAVKATAESARLVVLPPAPRGSGLIGAAVYALAGMGGGAMSLWTR